MLGLNSNKFILKEVTPELAIIKNLSLRNICSVRSGVLSFLKLTCPLTGARGPSSRGGGGLRGFTGDEFSSPVDSVDVFITSEINALVRIII